MYEKSLQHGFYLLVYMCCCFQSCCPLPQKGINRDVNFVQSLDFDYLKIDASIAYQDHAYRRGNAHVKLRIKKDHIIWFSVLGPWGIEILRGVATPVGVTLLNRIQKTYAIYDYATLSTLWPGPWDYALLQALLLGELVHTPNPHKVVQQHAQQTVIQQQKEAWTLTHCINPTLKKVAKLVALSSQGSWQVTYDQFKPCQGGLLSRRAILTWYCRTTPTKPAMTLTLKAMKPQWPTKALHFPCSIPVQYEKKQAVLDW
jgi:Domain of unknown function (DUF4292)